MANMTQANLNADIRQIFMNSGSPNAAMVNVQNYVWDCFVTQPSATAPTLANEAQAMTDTITTANLDLREQWAYKAVS